MRMLIIITFDDTGGKQKAKDKKEKRKEKKKRENRKER